jgi:hypothetical protein
MTTFDCRTLESRVGDYLDGTLPDDVVVDVELHLSVCDACRAMADDLRAIVIRSASLPVLAPSRDLWPDIAGRIAPQVLPFALPGRRRRWLPYAAIAAGLAGIAALGVWRVSSAPPASAPAVVRGSAVPSRRETSAPTPSATVPSPAVAATPVASAPERAAVRPDAQATYVREITRLRQILAEDTDNLEPTTVAILESSIATIDSAIVRAERALADDPGSQFLSNQLTRSLERKLGLLRRAALLSAST